MCYTITDSFKNSVIGDQRMMPWPMVVQIIDECDELKVPSIPFSWRGEATLINQLILTLVRQKILQMSCPMQLLSRIF